MATPPAVAETAFAVSALANLTSSLATLNSLRHKVTLFHQRMDEFRTAAEACGATLLAWDEQWNYKSYSEDVYQLLWGPQHHNIHNARTIVGQNLTDLAKHIERVLGTDLTDQAWRKHLSIHRRLVLRRFVFALFSHDSLVDRVGRLTNSLQHLKELTNQRLAVLSSSRPGTNFDATAAARLGLINIFGRMLFQLLPALEHTSEWALELRPPDVGGGPDAENWQRLDALRVWLIFRQGGVWRRVVLQYTLRNPQDDHWENLIINPNPNLRQATNPEVLGDQPLLYWTASFRALFTRGFFEQGLAYSEWQADQACLLLSLCNWAIILWMSDWTTNFCCSAIRFAKTTAHTEAATADELRVHALSIQENHIYPAQQGQAPEPQQPQQQNQECNHTGSKLKNFGLVIAETICRTPFRQADASGVYQKWEHRTQTWVQITEPNLLDFVYRRSKAYSMRRAVNFCLTANDPGHSADGIGNFYMAFLEEVFVP